MISPCRGTSLFAASSFEERSLTGPAAFLEAGGATTSSFLVSLGGTGESFSRNVTTLRDRGFTAIAELDRFSSRSLWAWTWQAVNSSGCDVLVDATCFPRELLAMLLFAFSVRRQSLARVRVLYTAPTVYVTQCDVPKEEQWLTRGIRTLRSVVGYPGDFASERKRHVVALAGHEVERLLEIISYLEPTKLSISNEEADSSTVEGASELSATVKARLREMIGLPEYGEVRFFANSIERTFESLHLFLSGTAQENVALVAMNTKLSFIASALCCLHQRHVRLVYAVPQEYNPCYSSGVGSVTEVDITSILMSSATTPVHSTQAELPPRA